MNEEKKAIWWQRVLTVFVAGALVILFYFFMKNLPLVGAFLTKTNRILRPFFIGFVLAYLLTPVYNWSVRKVYPALARRLKTKRSAFHVAKGLATLLSMIVLALIIAGFLWLMVPQIVKSISAVINILPGRIVDLKAWLVDTLTGLGHPEYIDTAVGLVDQASKGGLDVIMNQLLPGDGSMISRITSGTISVVRLFLDMLIGLISCVYFLNGKEVFLAQVKRFLQAHCKPETVKEVYAFGNFTNVTFSGFINGKIIDSIIIGILCSILMLILRLPYPVLISTIVGVTNVIPFFGPFIGAIPAAIIICVNDPIQALIFLIMILGLQQFDGNILGPKILGGQVGLSSFWVMFSIIVCGGYFGVLGMLFGVPLTAIIIYYLDKNTGERLKKKGAVGEVEAFINYAPYDITQEEASVLRVSEVKAGTGRERRAAFFRRRSEENWSDLLIPSGSNWKLYEQQWEKEQREKAERRRRAKEEADAQKAAAEAEAAGNEAAQKEAEKEQAEKKDEEQA